MKVNQRRFVVALLLCCIGLVTSIGFLGAQPNGVFLEALYVSILSWVAWLLSCRPLAKIIVALGVIAGTAVVSAYLSSIEFRKIDFQLFFILQDFVFQILLGIVFFGLTWGIERLLRKIRV